MSLDQDPVPIALLALPETAAGVLYSLYETFGFVGGAWSYLTGRPDPPSRRLTPAIVARDRAPFASPSGTIIGVDRSIDEPAQYDVVLVTDLACSMWDDPRGRWPDEVAWLKRQVAGGAMVCSVCTGSVVLAEAGLLDGEEATSHWAAVPIFRDFYPQVRLQPARILCPAGPEHRIVTSGGAAAWNELALYLIARLCGEQEARRIARALVIGDRSDGQLPFAAMVRPRQHDDRAIAAAQAWAADNYTLANPVARMAERAGLPERTFARRFRKATGYSPVEYIQSLRVEEAKQMLETTDDSTEAIAAAVGYADAVFLRRLFKRKVGVSPARYRQRFQRVGAARR